MIGAMCGVKVREVSEDGKGAYYVQMVCEGGGNTF